MGQYGGELVTGSPVPSWTCVKATTPARRRRRSFSFRRFSPSRPSHSLHSPPKISGDFTFQVPPILRPRSPVSSVLATIVRTRRTCVTDCNGISRVRIACSRLSRVRVNLSKEGRDMYVHRSRAMFLLVFHGSRVKDVCATFEFRGIFERKQKRGSESKNVITFGAVKQYRSLCILFFYFIVNKIQIALARGICVSINSTVA